jgi:hypothetical protein
VGAPDVTYTWRGDYYQLLSPRLAVSFGWLNEGHLQEHHRDGWVSQLWATHELRASGLRLGLGLGIYRSFDTLFLADGYRNDHKTLPLLSLVMTRPIGDGPLSAQLMVNRTLGDAKPATFSVLAGIAASLGKPASAPVAAAPRTGEGDQSVVFIYGTTILNSDQSETAEAFSVAYRRRVSNHWAWTAGYVNEGNRNGARRDGVSFQGWLEGHYLERRLRLGVGFGPYLTRVEDTDDGHNSNSVRLSGRTTLAGSWRMGPHWRVHLTWNRTETAYHRDTDLLAAGLGFDW